MTQNVYSPEDWTNYTPVETAYGALNPPYNPDRVAEMVNAAMVELGTSIPPVAYLGCGPADTLISIALPNPVTQQDIDAALAKLNAICVDPTRNNLTEEQQEAADLQNKINNMSAAILTLAGDNAAVPAVPGIIDYLASAKFEADNPTNAAKIEALRGHLRSMAQDEAKIARAVKYLLRTEKKRETGVFSMTVK